MNHEATIATLNMQLDNCAKDLYEKDKRIAELERENARLDAALDEEISNRDQYHEWADRLAAEIARYFGVDIGEHSNANNPWEQAYEAVPAEASTPAVEQQKPEHVAYAENGALHWMTGRKFQNCELYTAPQAAETDKVREADAWMTEDGERVVTNRTMEGARRDGGAMLSSMAPYSVALVRARSMAAQAPVREVPEGWKLVPRQLTEEQSREIVYNINRKYKGNLMSDFLAREVWSWGMHAAPAAPVQQEGV